MYIKAEEKKLVTNNASIVMGPKSGWGWSINSGFINFKLNVQARDRRYKFVFDQIVIDVLISANNSKTPVTLSYDQLKTGKGPINKHVLKEINTKILAIAQHMEHAVQTGKTTPIDSGNDNW